MPSLHKTLGIPSQEEADELELDLGIRFDNLTHDQRETWKQQTVYLGLYAQTRTFTHAARAAGVSIRKVRSWQAENTLGFNRRLQYAVLEYTEEIDLMLLRHARKPDCPPSLLMMFLRSQMPEKYGPARRDIHDLKQFAGLTEPPVLSPLPFAGEGQGEGEDVHPNPSPSAPNPPAHAEPKTTPSPSAPSAPSAVNRPPSVRPEPVEGPNPDSQTTHPVIPANAGIHPPIPSAVNPPAPSTQPPEPTLNRRQRRQLQRQQRKHKTKQPNSHRPRAPN